MKLYATREEAEKEPQEGKRLFVAKLNGTEMYAWGQRTAGHFVGTTFLKHLGGSVGLLHKRISGNKLLALHKMPTADALALLDTLRAEIVSAEKEVSEAFTEEHP